ncbi:MAG TPA: ABC transporter ATP-binding protein [Streptosporangiaceae bacterium]|nr:ABC transporter ATP-binding protein [Streptosporangiaceae bacterium]
MTELDPVTLAVDGLHVSFGTPDGTVHAVRGASFCVEAGATLGVVGESGSGKSVSMLTLLGLTSAAQVAGTALFRGRDLLTMSEDDLRRVRGAQISMIFQDPLTSLHPHYRIGWQIAEAVHAHEKVSRAAARSRAVELLATVGIPRASQRANDFPHQFSGGMRQRAMIAMALALRPALIIADEPTTALDATVEVQILQLLRRVQREFRTSLIMITHDLGVIAGMADVVMVMYAGRPVEIAGRRAIYRSPRHPYTRGLLNSVPGARGSIKQRLTPIPGQPPSMIRLPGGCPFHPRCAVAIERCREEEPPLIEVGEPGQSSACWRAAELDGLES